MEGVPHDVATTVITGLITAAYGLIAWAIREAAKAKKESRDSVDAHRRLTLESLRLISTIQLEVTFSDLESREHITAEQHRRWSKLYGTYIELEGRSRHIDRLNEVISLKKVKG